MQQLIWVTGSAGNLGRAICQRFLEAGYRVVGALAPGEAVPAPQPGIEYRPVELTDEAAVQAELEAIARLFGPVDVAVLTAGGFAMGDIASTSLDQLRAQVHLNLDTTYPAVRALLGPMKARRSGRIFMVGSRPGLDMRNGLGMTAYAMSKSLVFRLAELVNQEAAGTDVTATVIVPSIIDTMQNRASMPGADFSTWVTPEKIAEIVHFHCTAPASVLRESVLKVYGGA